VSNTCDMAYAATKFAVESGRKGVVVVEVAGYGNGGER
jgi:hypothetical protein